MLRRRSIRGGGDGSRARRRVSRARLVREMVESREFERIELLDDGLAFALRERRAPREARPGRPRELRAPAWSDERAIEIPWCLARYDGERRVLDVGSAIAEPAYLAVSRPRRTTSSCRRPRAAPGPTVIADVRSLPFADGELRARVLHLDAGARRPRQRGLRSRRRARRATARRRRCASCAACSRPAAACSQRPDRPREDQGWQLQREPLEWMALFERTGSSSSRTSSTSTPKTAGAPRRWPRRSGALRRRRARAPERCCSPSCGRAAPRGSALAESAT